MTGTQRKIIRRLIHGETLHEPSFNSNVFFWFSGFTRKPGTVHRRVLDAMRESGLIGLVRNKDGQTEYRPTEFAVHEVQK